MKSNKAIIFGILMFVFFVPLVSYKTKVSVLPVSADFIVVAYLAIIV
jgi:hypothetical protein